jgi:flagellar basal-body rod modification protein FlgD
LAIQSVNSTPTQATAGQALSQQTVTQDDFLKLLIAQLQNQDPLSPMDNQQFAVQLATFNSLGQLISINNELANLQTSQGATNQFNAASLIGKEIASNGNTLSLQTGNPAAINYQLGANASKVVVNIQDSSGALVRQMIVGAQNAGNQSVLWDGKDASGNAAPAGLYNFEVNAFDINGKQVQASGYIKGTVTGVRLDGSEPVLEVGALQVPLSAVSRVSTPQ